METKMEYTVTSRVVNGYKIKEYVPKRTLEEEQKFSQKVTRIVYNVLRQHGHIP